MRKKRVDFQPRHTRNNFPVVIVTRLTDGMAKRFDRMIVDLGYANRSEAARIILFRNIERHFESKENTIVEESLEISASRPRIDKAEGFVEKDPYVPVDLVEDKLNRLKSLLNRKA